MKKMKNTFLFVVMLWFNFSCFSQDNEFLAPLVLGEKIYHSSKYLDEVRQLNIFLPHEYGIDSTQAFQVLYLLDGSENEDFIHIVGLVQFLTMYELMPPTIVIGIENVDRYRDFTHISTNEEDLIQLPTSGGSSRFIEFLEFEVIPMIEQNYKVSDNRIILGQSLGGLLVTEIMLKKPYLFSNYIAVSPSLWWGEQSLLKNINNFLEQSKSDSYTLIVSLGKEHPVMHEVADELVESLQCQSEGNKQVFYYPILEENHATILHKAAYKAFETLGEKGRD